MKEKLLRLLNHSVVYGVSQMATKIISFLLLPAYTYWLSPEEYGAVTLYYSFIAAASVIYTLGTDVALIRFYTPEKISEQRKSLFSTVLLLALLNSTVLSLILWILKEPLSRLILEKTASYDVLSLCLGVLWFDTMMALPFVVLRAEQRSYLYGILRISGAILNLFLNWWLVGVLSTGLWGVLFSNLLSSSITFFILLCILHTRISYKIDFPVIPRLIKFGLPNILILFSVYSFELGARKILEVYGSLEQTGYYGVGAKLGMTFSILSMSFRSAWQPFFLEEGFKPGSPELFARVMTYFLLIFSFLFLMMTFFVPDFFMKPLPLIGKSLIEERYWKGFSIFPIILLGQMFNGITANLSTGFFLKNRLHVQAMICVISAIIAMTFNLLLIEKWGMWASAWSIVVGYGLIAIGEWWFTQRSYPIPYEWRRILLIFVFMGILWYVGTQLFENIFVKLLVLIAFPVLLWKTGFFLPTELSVIREKVFKIVRKYKK
ncbi:MAG: oligosaccharide flippase family protein [bacterium]|nr:oligosaccharide flippase family protein [bacterium]